LWADNTLLLNGKNKIKYTNNSAGPMELQLVIKLFDETNENGKVIPAGNYSMWKGDSSFSDGETELPGETETFLCVNSRLYARNTNGELFNESYFADDFVMTGNTIFILSNYAIYKYSTEGIFLGRYSYDSPEYGKSIDAKIDENGNGFVVLGNSQAREGSGEGSEYDSGSVEIFDQDFNFLSTITNPNNYGGFNDDRFGYKVALSAEGMLVVLARNEEEFLPYSGSGSQGSGAGDLYMDSGAVYIFDIGDGTNPTLTKTIDLMKTPYPVAPYSGFSVEIDAYGKGVTGRIIVSHRGEPEPRMMGELS